MPWEPSASPLPMGLPGPQQPWLLESEKQAGRAASPVGCLYDSDEEQHPNSLESNTGFHLKGLVMCQV